MSKELSPEIIDLGFGLGYELAPEPVVAPVELFNVSERAALTIAALGSLGLVQDKAKASESIEIGMTTLHSALAADHNPGDPDVEPYFNLVLNDKFTLDALRTAFDTNQTAPSFVYDEPWSQYTTAELNRTSLVKTNTDPKPHVTAMLLGGNHQTEAGLYHTARTLTEQIELVGSQSLVTPAGYIVLSAQRREAGEPLLDRQTFSRFPQLPVKYACGYRFAGGAHSVGGRPGLGWSRGRAGSCVGVRLSVG